MTAQRLKCNDTFWTLAENIQGKPARLLEYDELTTHYEQVLGELMSRREKLAKTYVPKLYKILRNEEKLPHENCYARVLQDCGKIWAEDTVMKYIPDEAKNTARRKAGKISAAVRKRQQKESVGANVSNTGQSSLVLGTNSSGDSSAGFNPTENGANERKEQESRPEGTDKRSYYCAGCNEKSSSLEELQRELEIKDLEIALLEGEVAELKDRCSKECSETIVTFSHSVRFEELRYQMEDVFKITNGMGDVWVNGKIDTKSKKILDLTISAAPANRMNDSTS
ncbi:MAG: hypothetical protein WBX01_09130 [Nitrososphaeraceae archaeon]